MKNIIYASLLFLFSAGALQAQTTPAQTPTLDSGKGAVPIKEEPHHHLILENAYVRVFRVEIISPDATLLHRHDTPYAYMSIGRADFINAVEGKPEARVTMANGQLGYSKGGFSHIVRTTNDIPFYNITVELLHRQENIHSDCAKTLSGPLEGCSTPQETVAESAHSTNAELAGGVKSGASPGTGTNTPLAQSAPDDAKMAVSTGPPVFTTIFDSDESTLKSGAFAANAKTSLQAPTAGILLVVEPLSQFKLEFSDGSSKLLSGADTLWLEGGSSTTVTNSSEANPSSLLIFSFKDVGSKEGPKPAGN
jgi:hypothetical protein